MVEREFDSPQCRGKAIKLNPPKMIITSNAAGALKGAGELTARGW